MRTSKDTNEVAHSIEEKVNEILRQIAAQSANEQSKIYFEQFISTEVLQQKPFFGIRRSYIRDLKK